jgi:hypothetical protein
MHMVLFGVQTMTPGAQSAVWHRILISVMFVGGAMPPQTPGGGEHLCLSMQGRLLVLEQRGDAAHAAAG